MTSSRIWKEQWQKTLRAERAQVLAAGWKKLVEGFTGGDPDITASINRMWQDRENWPDEMNQRAPVIRRAGTLR
jgi:hypothetical protein